MALGSATTSSLTNLAAATEWKPFRTIEATHPRAHTIRGSGPFEVDLSASRGPSHLRWGGGEGGNKNKKTRGARGGAGSDCHKTWSPGGPRGRGPGVDGLVGWSTGRTSGSHKTATKRSLPHFLNSGIASFLRAWPLGMRQCLAARPTPRHVRPSWWRYQEAARSNRRASLSCVSVVSIPYGEDGGEQGTRRTRAPHCHGSRG